MLSQREEHPNTVLVCQHRDRKEKELEAQEAPEAQLENPEPEDGEEDMGILVTGGGILQQTRLQRAASCCGCLKRKSKSTK